ncbi:hypothetical protein HAX54_043893, partial [Datura stramonium]|nr:hypothetical protein [Datura stramonium]
EQVADDADESDDKGQRNNTNNGGLNLRGYSESVGCPTDEMIKILKQQGQSITQF